MKKIILSVFCVSLLWACNNTTNSPEQEENTQAVAEAEQQEPIMNYYGDTISPDGAVDGEKLLAMLKENDSVAVKVQGVVNSSCKMKGCWMKMDMAGKEMHVKFKDYGFFVPKNLSGETAILEGYAKMDTMGVAELRHLASDAGKSQEEIDKITEPEVSITYLANGVIIKE